MNIISLQSKIILITGAASGIGRETAIIASKQGAKVILLDLYERQMEGFDKVKEILSQGRQTPSENASDVVLELIARRNRQ